MASAAALSSLGVRAQKAMPVIGFLSSGESRPNDGFY